MLSTTLIPATPKEERWNNEKEKVVDHIVNLSFEAFIIYTTTSLWAD